MEPKFHLGVVVRFKSEAFARTNGLLLAGPFSIAEIASHRIHPLFKLLKAFGFRRSRGVSGISVRAMQSRRSERSV